MIIRWQQIVQKMPKGVSQKLKREVIRNYYHAFKSSIDNDTDIDIKHIGTFKSTLQTRNSDRAQKAHDKRTKGKLKSKLGSRQKRMWVFERFDDYWEL